MPLVVIHYPANRDYLVDVSPPYFCQLVNRQSKNFYSKQFYIRLIHLCITKINKNPHNQHYNSKSYDERQQ